MSEHQAWGGAIISMRDGAQRYWRRGFLWILTPVLTA